MEHEIKSENGTMTAADSKKRDERIALVACEIMKPELERVRKDHNHVEILYLEQRLHAAGVLPEAQTLLLSDVLVTEALARAFAARVAEACAVGSSFTRVLAVDPGRSTRTAFLDALDAHGVDCGGGFVAEAELLNRARAGARVCLLATDAGAPVEYCI